MLIIFSLILITLFSQLIAMAWYSPVLFGEQRKKCGGVSAKKNSSKAVSMALFLSSGSTAVMAFMLLQFIRVSFFASQVDVYASFSSSLFGSLIVAFFVWIGFIAPVLASAYASLQKPFGLFLIDAAYQFVNIMAAAIILTFFL